MKWLLRHAAEEEGTAAATHLIEAVLDGRDRILQPVHWLVEVGAVLARLSPKSAKQDIEILDSMKLPTAAYPRVLLRGCDLSIELGQHLFDTLYHAVALETSGAVLVTADERYLRRARSKGRIIGLDEWSRGAEV